MIALPSVLQFGVPGGPELVIVILLFVLAFPAASLALGVGVGWWLRGRRDGDDGSPDSATETEPDTTATETEIDSTATETDPDTDAAERREE